MTQSRREAMAALVSEEIVLAQEEARLLGEISSLQWRERELFAEYVAVRRARAAVSGSRRRAERHLEAG